RWLAEIGTSGHGQPPPPITVWDAVSGKEWLSFLGVYSPIEPRPRRVAWRPGGMQLAGITTDSSIHVWDIPNKRLMHTLTQEVGTHFFTPAWSPDGRRLAASNDAGVLTLWDMDTGQERLTLRGNTARVWSLAWSGDGRRLASGGDDGQVVVW